MNYKVLAISVIASGVILGYFFMQSQALEEAAQAHRPAAAHVADPGR
jgi:hypothetical protein